MSTEPGDNLLRIAKRHLDGSDGSAKKNPDHAFNLLRAIVGLYPRSRAAQEAREILASQGISELGVSPNAQSSLGRFQKSPDAGETANG